MRRPFRRKHRSRNTSDVVTASPSRPTSPATPAPSDRSSEHADVWRVFEQYGNVLPPSTGPLPDRGSGPDDARRNILFVNAELNAESDTGSVIYDDGSESPVRHLGHALDQEPLVNDREQEMENVMRLLSKLPDSSQNRQRMTEELVARLWKKMQHPPLSRLGTFYTYRQADGSYNNVHFPNLGKTGTSYSRSVQPCVVQPAALPDPGLVFDSVMSRKNGGFKRHPGGLSSFCFYFATIIAHDLFRTSRTDLNVSTTSSYLDLSPLYGNNQEEQTRMRTLQRGRLKPDCFSEKRLLGFPVGVGLLMICFNRYHNWVAEHLALINEGGRFVKPNDDMAEEVRIVTERKYDNDIFQTARHVVCGLYMNIFLNDYLRVVLGLNRTNSTWRLDPRTDIAGDGAPRGTGNNITCEFSLCYRFHSAVSERDEKWTEEKFSKLFPNGYHDINSPDFIRAIEKLETLTPASPEAREFAGLERRDDGTFSDDKLATIFLESVEDPAGAFGPNNVPHVMRVVDILLLRQGRAWGCASLNEFRKFFGLVPHETFEHVNPNPEVASRLKALYKHPDFVELYSGIMCEEARELLMMDTGSGLCPTNTCGRAILTSAVSLVRGDRFHTLDYHAKNLTNWGIRESGSNPAIDHGCVAHKLLLRALPRHLPPNLIHAHHPFVLPSENKTFMRKLGRRGEYTFHRPHFDPARSTGLTRPIPGVLRPRLRIRGDETLEQVLRHEMLVADAWKEPLQLLMGKMAVDVGEACGHGLDFAMRREQQETRLLGPRMRDTVASFVEAKTTEMLLAKSVDVGGSFNKAKQVDIVREVGNLVAVHLMASMFALPMKHGKGDCAPNTFTDEQLHATLGAIYTLVFHSSSDPACVFALQAATKPLVGVLSEALETDMVILLATSALAAEAATVAGDSGDKGWAVRLRSLGVAHLRELVMAGLSAREAAWTHVLPCVAAFVVHQGCMFAHVVDFYLGDVGKEHWDEVCRMAASSSPPAETALLQYALEAIRLNGNYGIYRTATKDVHDIESYDGSLQAGTRIRASHKDLASNERLYPDASEFKLDRPPDTYHFHGYGPHEALASLLSRLTMVSMLRAVARLENLRRAPGPAGEMKVAERGGVQRYPDAFETTLWSFPTGMLVHFDKRARDCGHDAGKTEESAQGRIRKE